MPTTSFAATALLLIGLAAARAQAQQIPVAPTGEQAALIRKIEGRLMAPCCYTQTILDHQSDVAAQMREEVTAMVASGKSEAEIITYYRVKYGETILVVPDGLSGGLLAFTPPLLFIASACFLFFGIRRSANLKAAAATVGAVESPPERSALLEIIRRETAGDF